MGRGYSGNHPRYSKHGDEKYDAKEAYNKDLTASARLHYLENDRHDHSSPANFHHDSWGRMKNTLREIGEYTSDPEGYYDNPRYQDRLQGFAEDVTAPGGLDYENLQARAHHADWRRALGYDNAKDIEDIKWARDNAGMDIEPTGFDNSSFIKEPLPPGLTEPEGVKESAIPRLSRADRIRKRAMKRSERTGAERGDEYDYEDPRVQKMLEKANKLDERSGKGRKAMNKLTKKIEKLPDGPVWGNTQENELNRQIDERGGEGRDDSPLDACAKSEGGSGCVQQRGGEWKVISNKTGKPWPANYGSKANAEAALRGYHAG
tara:strand:+ start:679 stop:1635 length:957 start_codon:yes stop_codon:yes gene_type:complete